MLGGRTGRWPLLTGNVNLVQVESIDIRIASRLRRDGFQVVEVTAMAYAMGEG